MSKQASEPKRREATRVPGRSASGPAVRQGSRTALKDPSALRNPALRDPAPRDAALKNPAGLKDPATLDTEQQAAHQRERKLTQIAYERILNAIVQGRLDFGEPLSENDLAKAMNLSKAPVRESLGELRLKGLVEVVPQSGTYVFSPSAEQISELCDFRMLLETRAMRTSMQLDAEGLLTALRGVVNDMKIAHSTEDLFAAKQLDADFHRTIIRHSGNSYLLQSYDHISHTVEALRFRFMNTAIYREKAHNEHEKMVDLLANNQIAKATAMLEDHIVRTKRIQSSADWSGGRLRRKDYRFRDYTSIFL